MMSSSATYEIRKFEKTFPGLIICQVLLLNEQARVPGDRSSKGIARTCQYLEGERMEDLGLSPLNCTVTKEDVPRNPRRTRNRSS